jgi:hypothetical protein
MAEFVKLHVTLNFDEESFATEAEVFAQEHCN